jgi:hypothetical protein
MTTRLVGLKDFRQNLATYTKAAQKQNIRYVVLKKNVPVLEVRSLSHKESAIEQFAAEIAEARAQVKRGEVYTQEEVAEMFGF